MGYPQSLSQFVTEDGTVIEMYLQAGFNPVIRFIKDGLIRQIGFIESGIGYNVQKVGDTSWTEVWTK